MAYFNPYQPYPYQDQLGQLRGAPMNMPGQYLPPVSRPDSYGLNWVQGEAGAKSWIVTPGSTVLLMDSEGSRFYLKSADLSGVPALRTFEYTEVGAPRQEQTQAPQNFVTVSEYERFRNEVLGRLEAMTAKGESNE